MRKTLLVFVLALALVFAGCISQTPELVGTPTPKFTPTPVPTPTPELFELPEDTSIDAMGNRINSDDHFLQYLKLRDIRIYEYQGDTMLDGICTNTYSEELTGAFEIVFTDVTGVELARAEVDTRSGLASFPVGDTAIYAQIDTDMDIQLLPFTLVLKVPVWPQMEEIIITQ